MKYVTMVYKLLQILKNIFTAFDVYRKEAFWVGYNEDDDSNDDLTMRLVNGCGHAND